MTDLDVLNKLLSTLGEAPLQDIDEEHPLVPAAKRQMETTRQIELARGWWFNRERVTLVPDPGTGFVYIPDDTLSIDSTDTTSPLVQRGRRLYDTSKASYAVSKNVVVNLVRDVPFDDIPHNAQNLVASEAAVRFNLDYEGDTTKLGESRNEAQMARLELGREEIRNTAVNLFRRPSTAIVLNRIAGAGNRTRSF